MLCRMSFLNYVEYSFLSLLYEKQYYQILFILSVEPVMPVLCSLPLQIHSLTFSPLPCAPGGRPVWTASKGLLLTSCWARWGDLAGDWKVGGELYFCKVALGWLHPSVVSASLGCNSPNASSRPPGYCTAPVASCTLLIPLEGVPLLNSLQIIPNWVCRMFPAGTLTEDVAVMCLLCVPCVRSQLIDSSLDLVPR